MKCIYTVTNVFPTTENINSLSISLSRNIKDFTSALDTTELLPGYDDVTNEIVSIDICQEETTFIVSSELNSTLPSGKICEDTAVYGFDIENIFDVQIETECLLEDDSNTDCRSTQPDEDPEYCNIVVEYS